MKAKRVSTFILALILTICMAIPVNAVEVGSSNSTGNTPVEITAQATTFSITVPTVLPINVDADNNVTVATDCSIINNSAGPVKVTAAEVIAQNSWSLVDFTKDFSIAKVGLKEFGFQLNGSNVATDGSVSIENFNTINGYGSEPFTYDANIAVQKEELNNVQIAQVVFTVGWVADPGASEPASYPPYLTFSSPSSFTLRTNNVAKNWDGTLEYSTDTTTWKTWDGTKGLASSGNVLYLRGIGNTKITGDSIDYKWVFYGSDIACYGNIETLLDYATVQAGGHPTMADSCYRYMFNNCTSLTQAPVLPATTLATYCYYGMFEDCTSLTTAPALPATTLADYCYGHMFIDCTRLTTAPALPITTLAKYCYDEMFARCTSLTVAPALPATTLAESCYYGMFYGCTGLTAVPALPATTLATNCYQSMFNGCTSLKLSETQTGEYTQAYRVPTSGDGTTATNALKYMFINTGGAFEGTPNINTTYYLHSSNSIVE